MLFLGRVMLLGMSGWNLNLIYINYLKFVKLASFSKKEVGLWKMGLFLWRLVVPHIL